MRNNNNKNGGQTEVAELQAHEATMQREKCTKHGEGDCRAVAVCAAMEKQSANNNL